ncbi:DinB family protein [Fulvivirga kasyanovii]|uniref:DUF664 domain-containing protein n=1 Tax=Fulvivirga kasyanovii TaxID=396812 RepID=A0ABW9RMD0_9BACT|nr:DinB family protein [Fulvivirga kasyanovii]MTI24335.1 DUF664 domain-containing protein [Fulvivirga kasyanovii]
MKTISTGFDRRNFIKTTTAAVTTGILGLSGFGQTLQAGARSSADELYVIGPMDGYTPQVGTLVSMLNYNRQTIINSIKGLSMEQLDYLHDEEANTIGALVLHLGAVEKYYQINTFEERQEFSKEEEKEWGAAMNLGDEGREQIKGHKAEYYIDVISQVREKTLEELKKKDDDWLLAVDPVWSKERPLNTYWKWFHVCEHESNHRGQIAWLLSRIQK